MALGRERREEILRWFLSGAAVVLLHGGIAAAVLWHEADEPDDPGAALVIELAPMPVGPTEEHQEIPPGPQQVQADASPQNPAEKVEEKPEEEKVEKPEVKKEDEEPELPPVVNPEVALAAVPPEPKPETLPPAEASVPAPETTAPEIAKVEEAPVAAAPEQGRPHISNSSAVPTWRRRVVLILERNKRYPAAAQAARQRGTTEVAFSIDRQGRVLSSRIVRSSGSSILDQESLNLLRRAQPFPPPPPELAGAQIDLSVPIQYNIR